MEYRAVFPYFNWCCVHVLIYNSTPLMFQGDDSDELMAVFGLDPKLYTEKEKEEKFPENHLGRIFFNLRFEG